MRHDWAVDDALGIGLVAGGAALGIALAFLLRARLPGPAVAVGLGAAGALIGAGGLLLQERAGPADWVVAVAGLAVLVPFHVRVVLGPLGRRAGT
ncbi:MAG: hypothetical protein HY658_03590 [Actinobacteria bacterium]|nr:hypothetical protein [Actinomycetota bacterium]